MANSTNTSDSVVKLWNDATQQIDAFVVKEIDFFESEAKKLEGVSTHAVQLVNKDSGSLVAEVHNVDLQTGLDVLAEHAGSTGGLLPTPADAVAPSEPTGTVTGPVAEAPSAGPEPTVAPVAPVEETPAPAPVKAPVADTAPVTTVTPEPVDTTPAPTAPTTSTK